MLISWLEILVKSRKLSDSGSELDPTGVPEKLPVDLSSPFSDQATTSTRPESKKQEKGKKTEHVMLLDDEFLGELKPKNRDKKPDPYTSVNGLVEEFVPDKPTPKPPGPKPIYMDLGDEFNTGYAVVDLGETEEVDVRFSKKKRTVPRDPKKRYVVLTMNEAEIRGKIINGYVSFEEAKEIAHSMNIIASEVMSI